MAPRARTENRREANRRFGLKYGAMLNAKASDSAPKRRGTRWDGFFLRATMGDNSSLLCRGELGRCLPAVPLARGHPVCMRAGLELRARPADRHQAQWFLVHSQCQYALHLGIIERADHDGPEIKRDGLQMDVLSGVPDLHLHIPPRSQLVFPGGSLVKRGDDNGYRSVVQPVLFQCRASQFRSLVPLDHRDQIVALRPIPVHARGQLVLATRYEKNLQRVERAGRRSRAFSLGIGDSLGGPEQLRNLCQRQSSLPELPDGPSPAQGRFNGCFAFLAWFGEFDHARQIAADKRFTGHKHFTDEVAARIVARPAGVERQNGFSSCGLRPMPNALAVFLDFPNAVKGYAMAPAPRIELPCEQVRTRGPSPGSPHRHVGCRTGCGAGHRQRAAGAGVAELVQAVHPKTLRQHVVGPVVQVACLVVGIPGLDGLRAEQPGPSCVFATLAAKVVLGWMGLFPHPHTPCSENYRILPKC